MIHAATQDTAVSRPPGSTKALGPRPASHPDRRLINMRMVGAAVVVIIDDNGVIQLIHATRADEPELGVLTANERSRVHSAVLAMHKLVRGGSP